MDLSYLLWLPASRTKLLTLLEWEKTELKTKIIVWEVCCLNRISQDGLFSIISGPGDIPGNHLLCACAMVLECKVKHLCPYVAACEYSTGYCCEVSQPERSWLRAFYFIQFVGNYSINFNCWFGYWETNMTNSEGKHLFSHFPVCSVSSDTSPKPPSFIVSTPFAFTSCYAQSLWWGDGWHRSGSEHREIYFFGALFLSRFLKSALGLHTGPGPFGGILAPT